MLYRFIISGYTDKLAYASALITAIWMFTARQYGSAIPGCLATVSPWYGVAFSAFTGALLICKYVCIDGKALEIDQLNAEKVRLEESVIKRDLIAVELNERIEVLSAEKSELCNRIAKMEENSPTVQLAELRRKLRSSEDDRKSALTVFAKNLQARLDMLSEVNDAQLLFAADVLRKEVELVENEIKRGDIPLYELCLKIVNIGEKLSELKDIDLAASFHQAAKQGDVSESWLNLIRANDSSDHDAVERSFKFFKVAFHPDKFKSESLKAEATRYFQQSINAHNSLKRTDTEAQ
jgi:hypothetical protein